ncbi:CapA family protein [Nesterenkonia natronophila]|uniref:ATP-grasp domain-containing protein n=1 Tax=Nesterenkonia natronophila TaxID=2174932 RepID=A0A3A4F1E6_9MICC|nr:hypothetical protein D3250_08235 [Nesterenkonia natronophila]
MRQLGVDAVHLATPSPLSEEPFELESALPLLEEQDLAFFGVGQTLHEAVEPLRVRMPASVGGGELAFHCLHHRGRGASARNSSLIARQDRPGLAPLSTSEIPRPRQTNQVTDALHIAMPSWRTRSAWHNRLQYSLAQQMLNKDFDLILGSHNQRMQEVERHRGRWVVYGLGDSSLLANNDSKSSRDIADALPFTMWAILEIRDSRGLRNVSLKLYPMRSQTSAPNHDAVTGPVSEEEFEDVVEKLSQRPIRRWRLDNPGMTRGADELGHHLRLNLGEWPPGRRPSRLSATPAGDPNEWPLKSPGTALEDAAIRFNRPSGAMTLPLGAEAAGAEVRWLTESTSVITAGAKCFLTNGPTAHESDLGSTIVADKALTAQLLEGRGVSTPQTKVVHSSEEAVEAARTMAGSVVLKPKGGNQGRGVSTDLLSDADVRLGFEFARRYGDAVIVQEHIVVGKEMRVMASPDQVVAVNERVFPHVVGDGSSTIQELIQDKNVQRARNTIFKRGAIPMDEVTRRFLQRQGITLNDVPPLGHTVTVRNVGGNSMGADIRQDLDNASDDVKATAREAIAAIPGLVWGGVDIITDLRTGKAFVIEINTNAGFLSAAFPTYGQPRDVTQDIYQLRFADTVAGPPAESPIQMPCAARAIAPLTAQCGGDQENWTAGELIHEYFENQGQLVERLTDRVSIVESALGVRTWVTAGGRTSADRYVIRRVVKNPPLIMGLLEDHAVPVVRSRLITSIKSLARFMGGRTKQVSVLSSRSAWDGDGVQVLNDHEVLSLSVLPHRYTWVQARPSGRRLRVLATPDKAWLVTERRLRQALSTAEVEAVSRVAVRAVRAVPELRWGAVDVVLRRRRLTEGRPDPVLVEGVMLNPRYSQDDHVLAGSFDEFCRLVFQ